MLEVRQKDFKKNKERKRKGGGEKRSRIEIVGTGGKNFLSDEFACYIDENHILERMN